MIVTCGDTECQHYTDNGCSAPIADHTSDRFCVTGRKKQVDDYERMMRPDEPKGHRRNGKWVSN